MQLLELEGHKYWYVYVLLGARVKGGNADNLKYMMELRGVKMYNDYNELMTVDIIEWYAGKRGREQGLMITQAERNVLLSLLFLMFLFDSTQWKGPACLIL